MSDSQFDAEPEDSWDQTDALPVQLDNLVRRVELLTSRKLRTGSDDPVDVVDAIAERVRQTRRRRLTERELLRADQLDEDITHVRSRL